MAANDSANDSTPSPYSEIGTTSDRATLIGDDLSAAHRPFHRRHKWTLGIALALLLILGAHALAIYFIYFRCHSFNNCQPLRIMALNTWGMPAAFGSEYKEQRMAAIADEFRKAEYDLYLFEELWMQPDHETIAAAVPEGYKITGFRELALGTCDGRATPAFCSGLAVATRFPMESVEFFSYEYHGDPLKAWVDGEWLAKKGVGLVKMTLLGNVSVDVFVTHTAADPDQRYHNYTNEYYRVHQVDELMAKHIKTSEADLVLLGGDFNAGPNDEKGEIYHKIRSYMKNCIEDFWYKLAAWLRPDHATYGNKENTFSYMFKPVIYDYIFHRANHPDVAVWTDLFNLPFLKTMLAPQNKTISFSDHEAVTATIYVWKS